MLVPCLTSSRTKRSLARSNITHHFFFDSDKSSPPIPITAVQNRTGVYQAFTVRVRLRLFYLVLHNLFHSFLYNPVARESCIQFDLTPLPHNSYHARSTSTHLSLQYKGILFYMDVSIRNKVEKYLDPYIHCEDMS